MASPPTSSEPTRAPGQQDSSSSKPRRLRPRPWWLTFLLIFAANWLLMTLLFPETPYVNIPYTTFKEQIAAGNVVEIVSQGDAIQGTFKNAVTYPPDDPNARTATQFKTQRPAFADQGLETLLRDNNVVINARPLDEGRPLWQNFLLGFGPTLLLIGAFIWLSRRSLGASGGGLFGMGQSRAKRYSEEQPRVTFDDVAGIEEAAAELVEIVDFLKNPEKYQRLGGVMPKGVLLIGAPGTGKTLLARAIAGEAGVPFFSLSASEFIEMIVGVGAARVRDLFKQARAAAPSIIFIDELDAIGRSRGSGASLGGHDEREQTLNQILTEMDGFDPRTNVIVLAATNRADVLDPALLRPGRFDRRVMVQRPDRAGRAAILRVHTRGVPLAADVDLDRLAAETPGLVGAELRNLVNEAALLAARKGENAVRARDFSEAMEKVTLGPARNILLNPADREKTAYHESGHALLGLLVPGSDPVHRVTIVPRGMALGVTYQLPTDDRTNYTEEYLRARITSALGGRAAERLIYGQTSTGAENDLLQVTQIAQNMAARWGMSGKVGALNYAFQTDQYPPGLGAKSYSEATAEAIDAETRRIVEECEQVADRLLAENRERLDALAERLLEKESLDEQEILEVTGLPRREQPSQEPGLARAAAMAEIPSSAPLT